jgi:hypothetical protein
MFAPSHTTHDVVLANLHGQSPTSTKMGDAVTPPVPSDEALKEIQGELHHSISTEGKAEADYDADNCTPVKEKDDELWSQLSKILDLQSEIAHLHIEIEGVGTKSAEGRRNGGRKTTQDWEGVGDNMSQGDEAEANKVKEERFAALASKFTGRRAAIDGIMNKVCPLFTYALTPGSLRPA